MSSAPICGKSPCAIIIELNAKLIEGEVGSGDELGPLLIEQVVPQNKPHAFYDQLLLWLHTEITVRTQIGNQLATQP
jgi:hypothetical protein